MANIDEETRKQLAKSAEMISYHLVLAVKHSNSLKRVMGRGGSAEEIIARAKKETELLLQTERFIQSAPGNRNHQCKAGTIWDEELQRCIPI